MSVINHIGAAVDALLARRPGPAFRITAKSVRGKRGRRARRQAFYGRQRMARMLSKVMRGAATAEFERAWLEAASAPYGMAWLEMSAAGPRRIDPRTVFFDFDGQEVPAPDGSPRDGEIAGLVRTFNIDANTPFDRSFHGQDEAGRVRVVDTYSRPA